MEKKEEIVRRGLSISSGVAIEKAFVYKVFKKRDEKLQEILHSKSEVSKNVKKFVTAIAHAKSTLSLQRNRLIGKTKKYHLGIFEFQTFLLEDSSFIGKIREQIEVNKKSAYAAVIAVTDELSSKMKNTFEDIKDVGNLICSYLNEEETYITDIPEEKPFILITDILTPSLVSFLVNSEVKGVATELGGKTSHAVILSESLGVPVVVDIPDITDQVKTGDLVGMDGDCGKIVISPTKLRLKALKRLQKWHKRFHNRLHREAKKYAKTIDNIKINIWANIELISELNYIIDSGAEGIGLYRTEFIFLDNPNRSSDIDLQYNIYRSVVTGMSGRPVIFRMVDIGVDKVPYFSDGKGETWTEEANPALGYRGIRLINGHRNEIIIPQLKAILKASAYGHVKIMLPMVSLIEEVVEFIRLLEISMKNLGSEAPSRRPSLGIMLETPSSIILIDKFAKYVDFFSIGTNDLTQYVLAVDRNNARVAYMWDHFHPAVLALVKRALDYSKKTDIPISICGEAAGDPFAAAIFIGFGANTLSLSPGRIAEIKHFIRQWDSEELKVLADEVLNFETAEQVREFIKGRLKVGIL